MSVRLLIVEDDDRLREVLLEAAAIDGYEAVGAPTAEDGLERLTAESFDALITDVMLPGMSGLDLIPHARQANPALVILVMTAFGTVDIAVEAMKRGAADFLSKPFSLDALRGALRVTAGRVPTAAAGKSLWTDFGDIVATSAPMLKLLKQVEAIAPFNTTVLVTGETGTGKELVARAVHRRSPREGKAFVALNCAAVPENLLEDELFGHVKGAFTGAQNARAGRFEQADGGTLFLDEIGDMSLPLQSKLLRVLQEREFEKLGSSRTLKVDVRVVAATSADLERRIADGTFRPDLFYRLNVVHLRLPPLRERRDDIRPLAEHLLARFCAGAGLPAKVIDAGAWRAITYYRWPGNVRQLQNAMERGAALTGAEPVIRLEDLPEEVRGGSPTGITPLFAEEPAAAAAGTAASNQHIPEQGLDFDSVVGQIERDLLLKSLEKAGGNKMRAAKLLNMKRTTFVEKLKRLQVSAEDEGDAAEE